MNINKSLQLAFEHHQQGNLKQAEYLYKKILKKQPDNIDVLHMLGVIHSERGNYNLAIKCIKEALQINAADYHAYYNLGNAFRLNGQSEEAIDSYQKVIHINPYFADAFQNLGIVFQSRGEVDEAIGCFQKVIQLNPDFSHAYINLANIFRDKAQFDEAMTFYHKAIELDPDNAGAYCYMGLILQNKGQLDEAIAFYHKAIELDPDILGAYCNLGVILQSKGQPDEAITWYQRAIKRTPNYADAYYNLGTVFQDKGEFDKAISCYQKAIQLNPRFYNAYSNLGNILRDKGQLDEAMTFYQKTIELNPSHAGAYCNIGLIFQNRGQLDQATNSYQKAIESNPHMATAFNNMGTAFQDKGQLDEAMTFYQRALQIDSNYAIAHFHVALLLLLTGDFKNGWQEYEWRWKTKDFGTRNFEQPLWDGSDITGRTILLYSEQGIGDTIQFIRYAPLVAQRGAKVIVECRKELKSLLQNVEGVNAIVAYGEQRRDFDLHCPLLTLPLIFDTTLEAIPVEIPYIKVNASSIQKWKDKVKNDSSQLKIGLVWAGAPGYKRDEKRSFSLEIFSPFAHLTGVTFYSLQKGKAAEQGKNSPEGMKITDYTDEIQDFLDTAAFVENLDLVISVDTAVAHLAGALGKPVWTLIPFAPDWRWLLNREDSPWYPTMRLFRQPSPGDWQSVINNVLKEIEKFIRDENR